EFVRLLDGHPRHPPAFGGQGVTGAGQRLLLHEELLARSLPLLARHDRGCVHREISFPVFLVSACLLPSYFSSRYDALVVLSRTKRGASNGGSDKCGAIPRQTTSARSVIAKTLKAVSGNQSEAARQLG